MWEEYNNLYVLKWSFWVITATCCFNQVKIFVIYLIINNNFVEFYLSYILLLGFILYSIIVGVIKS